MPIDQPTTVRQGEALALEPLQQYLNSHAPEMGQITGIRQYPSGFSNLTYNLETSAGPNATAKAYVLRRPPFGASIKTAHDMGREHTVLSLLAGHYGKAPRPVAYCQDESVIGAPFYIMERVQGIILRNSLPPEITPTALKSAGEEVVDTLAALHALDLEATGLGKLGKPEGYVQRQVEGWVKRYYAAETDKVADMDALAQWMPANLPPQQPPAFIHNDYKFDNVVLAPEAPFGVKAILDWEMATVGDPLMDLGTTLAYWADATDHPALHAFGITHLPGSLNRQQVLERYASTSGCNVAHILFYYVFGCFKIGVICQQIYARFKKGHTQDPRFGALIHVVKACGHNGSAALKHQRIHSFR